MQAKNIFSSEKEKLEYVLKCEHDFESRLDEVVKKVCADSDTRYIALSGPTCSGKTTASKKLISEFSERGKKIKIISLDDFFRDARALTEEAKAGNKKLDFDSEKALDIPILEEFMEKIQRGQHAALPRFDFKQAKRVGYEDFHPEDSDVLIFEGIQAIYPAFTRTFTDGSKVKSFYISVLEDLKIGDKTVSAREIRLWRRLVRDHRYRAASPEFTFVLWEGVTENEDRNILPFASKTDYSINSLQGYEAGMLKEPLSLLMESIKPDSRYYSKSQQILQMIEGIEPISHKYLPAVSLYHEFL